MARDLHKMTGARAEVRVEAQPFWKLGAGQFDLLDITLVGVDFDGNRIKEVALHWQDGGVNLGDLSVGLVHITKVGVMTVTATLSAEDLGAMIPTAYRPFKPKLTVTPEALTMGGRVNVDGLILPVSLSGRLVPSADGLAIIFRPTRFMVDGRLLPSPADTTVFSLSQLHLPQGISLKLTRVHLEHGLVVLDLVGS